MAAAYETDLITVIIEDHRSMEDVFEELRGGAGTPRYRRALADHMIAELVRHTAAEEQLLYPAVREKFRDGDDIVEHEIAEHSEVEQLLNELETTRPDETQFDELVGRIVVSVRHHVKEEEDELLPQL